MQFQEVQELQEFVPNTTYKIIYFMDHLHYKGTYVGRDQFGIIFNVKNEIQYISYCKNRFYKPYFQKDKIQSDMERRALQQILKSIVGDETFSW